MSTRRWWARLAGVSVALALACSIDSRRLTIGDGGGAGSGASGGTGGVPGGNSGAGVGGVAGVAGTTAGMAGAAGTRVGSSCPEAGSLDCDGVQSRKTLGCSSSNKWEISGTCANGQLCDSGPGPSHGTCLPVIVECAARAGNEHVCINGELHACGPDLVTSTRMDSCLQATGECARCRPVTVVAGQVQPRGIAVDATNAYFSTSSTVSRAPLDGSVGATVLGSAGRGGGAIAIDGSSAYIVGLSGGAGGASGASTGNTPFAIPLQGGAPTRLDSSGVFYGSTPTTSLALDDNDLYWSEPSYLGGAVLKLPKTGGSSATLAMNQGTIQAMTLDTSHVYWTTSSGVIGRAPIQVGTAEVLATNQPSPRGIAVRDGYLFWNNGGAAVMTMPVTGGTPVTLAMGPGPGTGPGTGGVITGIAVDATTVYWSNAVESTIMKVPKAGGAAIIIARAATPWGLTIDATHVYWSNSGDGTIMKIAK